MMERFDIIGDIHGCFWELEKLLDKLNYQWQMGLQVSPEGRKVIFVGDLTDRGSNSIDCLTYIRRMVGSGYAMCVMGNHDNKLMRKAKGNKVQISHGLDKTIAQAEEFKIDLKPFGEFIGTLPYYLSLDGGKLVIVHAAWRDDFLEKDISKGEVKSWALYGPIRGMLADGMPDRIDWASQRVLTENSPWIVYGHQPYKEVRFLNKTVGIDTGCVFGGKLTALRYPEMELVELSAYKQYDKHPIFEVRNE